VSSRPCASQWMPAQAAVAARGLGLTASSSIVPLDPSLSVAPDPDRSNSSNRSNQSNCANRRCTIQWRSRVVIQRHATIN
jgi:hypothetical protein